MNDDSDTRSSDYERGFADGFERGFARSLGSFLGFLRSAKVEEVEEVSPNGLYI